jgi:peptidoglycan/xylan/chitin deacetylase (PgdA/CDA1 family)
MRTAICTALVICLVASLSVTLPAPAMAAPPAPDNPRRVVLEAGQHVGYRFNASGAIVSQLSITQRHPANAHATDRRRISGRGTFLYLVDGKLASYWVRESIVAYVAGSVASEAFEPARSISLPAGTIIGYRFTSGWKLRDAEIASLSSPGTAHADRLAVINGVRYYHVVDGGWAGTWVPRGASLAARALACHTGPRASAARRVVRTVSGAGPEVALTLDMGGRLDPAVSIMQLLLLHGVCTTIFPTGTAAQTDIGADVLAMVAAYPEVFEVGNHTMNHCNLVTGKNGPACPQSPPTARRIRRELTNAAAIIGAAAGQSPVPYWRPPFGAYNGFVLDAAASAGYTTTAMWGVDTIDWMPVGDGGPRAPQIVAKVIGNAVNGSVVLMHLGGYNTRDALPMMIHRLRADRDLLPTSLSDLLDRR